MCHQLVNVCVCEKQLVAIKQGCTLQICIFQIGSASTIDIKLSTSSSSWNLLRMSFNWTCTLTCTKCCRPNNLWVFNSRIRIKLKIASEKCHFKKSWPVFFVAVHLYTRTPSRKTVPNKEWGSIIIAKLRNQINHQDIFCSGNIQLGHV